VSVLVIRTAPEGIAAEGLGQGIARLCAVGRRIGEPENFRLLVAGGGSREGRHSQRNPIRLIATRVRKLGHDFPEVSKDRRAFPDRDDGLQFVESAL